MRKLVCVVAILGMVGTVYAGHWRGFGYGGDGTSWSDVLNWDDTIPMNPPGEYKNWDCNKLYEQGTPSNHVMNVDITGTTGRGQIYYQAGYTTTMNILDGVTYSTDRYLQLFDGSSTNGAADVYIKSGGRMIIQNLNEQLLYIGKGSSVTVEAGGRLDASWLELSDGYATLNVNDLCLLYGISKWSNDPGHEVNVYDGGFLQIANGGINWDGSTTHRINMYVGGTLNYIGDHRTDYLDTVTKAEPGTWDVQYSDGWTAISLVPEPASMLLFGLGSVALLRRRR